MRNLARAGIRKRRVRTLTSFNEEFGNTVEAALSVILYIRPVD